ncbi:MAG: MraY family glycosyltransferase [Candidatus Firestonebacteria bacterium]|nr:MraY family glycosyltransferase [Candidatus Firestonebacteria bacterium]
MLKKILFISAGAAAFCLVTPPGAAFFFTRGLSGFYAFLLALLLTALFTPLAVKAALRFNLLDYPAARKIHTRPVPRTGGAAIFTAFLLASFVVCNFSKEVAGLLAGLAVVFFAGFHDDLKSNSAFYRLSAQVAASCILISAGVFIRIFSEFPGSLILNYLLTVFWVTGIINAVNFMDGLDGLAAGLGLISGAAIFAVVCGTNRPELSCLLLAFLGVCAGFLPFNFKPAKIFLGDAGSSVIGYLLAGFSVMGVWNTSSPVIGFILPVLVLSLPIFDMLLTTFSRIKNGSVSTVKEWLEFTGKDHFHHRLLNLGFSQKSAVFFLYGLNLILCLLAFAVSLISEREALLLFLGAVLLFSLLTSLIRAGRKIA